jgi:hypothetical protein
VGIIRTARLDFSIGIFTGYTRAELGSGNFRALWNPKARFPAYKKMKAWGWLATKIDWAVMGRYNQLQPCTEPMLSSRNQELVHFSDRDVAAVFPDQALELRVSADGVLAQITGFPQGVTACETATT